MIELLIQLCVQNVATKWEKVTLLKRSAVFRMPVGYFALQSQLRHEMSLRRKGVRQG